MNGSFWLAAFLTMNVGAAPVSRRAEAGIPSMAFERRTLANGMTVLLREDKTLPIVVVNVWYKVGSKNEDAGKTGLAHFFEHYMFEGSDHAPDGGFDKAIFKCGGTDNATTNQDRTNYYALVPSECLEEELRVESDRMGFLSLNQAPVDKQRKIVKNEKRQRDNEAYAEASERMGEFVYGPKHPYGWPIIGSMQDLDGNTLSDFKAFRDRWYHPNNAVLVISGDFDRAQTLAWIETYFGSLPAGPKPPTLVVPANAAAKGRAEFTLQDDKAQLPRLIMAFRSPGRGKPGWQEMSVAGLILTGADGRLSASLRDKQRLVLSISAGTFDLHEQDIFLIDALPAPGVPLDKLEAAIRKELDEFMRTGPTKREMKQVKAAYTMATLNALQSLTSVAESMAEGEVIASDPASINSEMKRVRDMPRAAPQKAAQKYLTAPSTVVIKTLPVGGRP